jgi:hypothetical protein
MCHECDKPTMNKDGLCDDCKNPTMNVKWVSPRDPGDENDTMQLDEKLVYEDQFKGKSKNPLFMWLKKNG